MREPMAGVTQRRRMVATSRAALVEILALALALPGVASFIAPGHGQKLALHVAGGLASTRRMGRAVPLAMAVPSTDKPAARRHSWEPQDLTQDRPGCVPIPDDDYVKQYQRNPALWPVEFFLIVYRRTRNAATQKLETSVLVRKSANGTSKWGVGSGVPATRWVLSSQERPPFGYKWSDPTLTFDASHFPEFPRDGRESWAYRKIDIREDAFNGPDASEVQDPALEEYSAHIRQGLMNELAKRLGEADSSESWDARTLSVVKAIVDRPSSTAAIQGSLRMSGVFGPEQLGVGSNAPDPAALAGSMRVFTMFPQMPDPMPPPSASPKELLEEIASREARMAESGRDPHRDRHGRVYTHKSTNNVSNTIHGVYLTLDATGSPGLDQVPALDLFGTKAVQREWVSLEDLGVLDASVGISTQDTKPTFISGFIVRQLVREGIIRVQ